MLARNDGIQPLEQGDEHNKTGLDKISIVNLGIKTD